MSRLTPINAAMSPMNILLQHSMARPQHVKVSVETYLVTGPLRDLARKDIYVKRVKLYLSKNHVVTKFTTNLQMYQIGPESLYHSHGFRTAVKRLFEIYQDSLFEYDNAYWNPRSIKLLLIGSSKLSIISSIFKELKFDKSNEYIYTRRDFHRWDTRRRYDDRQREIEDGLLVKVIGGPYVRKEFVQEYYRDMLRIQKEKARGIKRRVRYVPRVIYNALTPPSSDSESSSDDDVAVTTN